MAKFNKLDVPSQWRDEFTKYPHGYTIFEALCKWVKQVDNMVDNINNWNDYLDGFVDSFDSRLQHEVQSTIIKWQSEGLLDDIIASVLNTELDSVKSQLADNMHQIENIDANILSLQTDKADITYVDILTASIASGSPKGTYATVTALTNAFPTGNTNIYVVAEDGKWYYWNGVAWTAGGVYQSTGIADKSITMEKTDFISIGTNKYNYKTATDNRYLNSVGGLLSGDDFYVSDYIDVAGQTKVTIGNVRHYHFYDANKTPISGDDLESYYGITVTVPSNAKFIRFSAKGLSNKHLNQLNYGEQLLDFTPYEVYVNNLGLHKEIDITKNKQVSLTKNMFNKKDVIEDKYVNWNNGTLADNTDYVTSQRIYIEPNTQYGLTNIRYFAWYDGNLNFISGSNDGTTHSEISPSTARYIQVSVRKENINIAQFEKGTPSSYVPYGYLIDNLVILEEKDKYSNLINLPDDIYVLVGEELNIYFDNIVSGKDKDYSFDVICSEGNQYENFYRIVPETSGNIEITINAYRDTKIVAQAKATIHKIGKAVGNGVTKSIVVIGDSTTNNGTAIEKLLENFEEDVMNVELVGTRGQSPALHEGRSGWKAENYVNSATVGGVANAFWNPSTLSFDFNYWVTNNSFAVPDYVIINLGINDIFNEYTDVAMENKIQEMIADYNEMITSIHSAYPSIKIGIALTIPPNYSQDGFAKPYGAGQTQERYKRNNIAWVNKLIETYDNREVENIYVIPINASLDTCYNMGLQEVQVNKRNPLTVTMPANNGGVHPSVSGYWQIADVYWFWLKSFEN